MKKFYIWDRGYFWTGCSWTNVIQFAKKYSLIDALTIRMKRFQYSKPHARIRLCKNFEKKKSAGDTASIKENKKAPRRNESAI